jgi:hypothetical protein
MSSLISLSMLSTVDRSSNSGCSCLELFCIEVLAAEAYEPGILLVGGFNLVYEFLICVVFAGLKRWYSLPNFVACSSL